MGKPITAVYKDQSGEWRWRFRAGNGEIMAVSSEGYYGKYGCKRAAKTVQKEFPNAPIIELD